MRLVFMGTPQFAVPTLERLIKSNYEIVAVYTQPDRPAGRGQKLQPSPVKRLAQEAGLTVVQPERMRRPEAINALAELRPDVIVVVAFGQILPQGVLDIPSFGCLNLHPSLLPKYRGASPIAGPISAGDKYTGVTVMLLDAGMDSGPILAQRQMEINGEDTTGSLAEKLSRVGADLLAETLPQWLERRIIPQPQNETEVTVTSRIKKENGDIDWSQPAVVIERRIRAFQPWPKCFSCWQGKRIEILKAVPIPSESKGVPGEVVKLDPKIAGTPVGVQTGKGVLGLLQLQMEGGRVMSAEEFIRGHRDFVGAKLERTPVETQD